MIHKLACQLLNKAETVLKLSEWINPEELDICKQSSKLSWFF